MTNLPLLRLSKLAKVFELCIVYVSEASKWAMPFTVDVTLYESFAETGLLIQTSKPSSNTT